ncbi:transmembrane secretion effector [Lentzea atacamensis]|uniref:Transmembrane secretion effector n=1 Tax=Lentzea atacamensis TaxID=531938 RepID=A0ABX9E898_9PSEU|nr:MFS transporter [Lentzea atacamensis]RAS65916.1 transmembrane secretion effector [Lentzea atacamensis]
MRRTMPPMFRALRHRNYRLWATADLISVTGSWMQVIGLNWVVLERTGSATSVGFSVLLSTLPAVLLGPWAGALADRLPVRRIVLVCQTLHAVLAGALAVAIWSDLPMAAVYAPQRRTALAHRVLGRHRSAPHPAGHPHQPTPLTRPRRRARVRAATRTTV